MRGRVASALAAAVAVVGLGVAYGAELRGTEGADRLIGTAGADGIRGLGGNDRIAGRGGGDFLTGGAGRDSVSGDAGPDRIAVHYDGAKDVVRCGLGLDVVSAELQDVVDADCEVVTRQLSRDPFVGPGQHETQVEPDGLAVRSTIVTAFQSGRLLDGGAERIGWATSLDAGRTWRRGFLSQVADRVSDPVVAFDRLRGTWLLALLAASDGGSELLVSRSRDGLAWSRPEPAVADPAESYDKEWLVCDNSRTSAFFGRCYFAYLDSDTRQIRIRRSSDGARTWSAPVLPPVDDPALVGNGAYPIVRPDGAVLVFYSVYGSTDPNADAILVTTSRDGGATFGPPRRVAALLTEEPVLRAPPFVSADVDSAGTVYVTWADCRFSVQCTANSAVIATSRDGIAWTAPRRVPFGLAEAAVDYLVPALAVDPASVGTRARIAIAAYSVDPAHGCPDCERVDAFLIESNDGGQTWRAAQRLNAESMALAWIADTGLGRMLADYISVSYVGGRPVAVVSLAAEPEAGEFRQAIFASTRVP